MQSVFDLMQQSVNNGAGLAQSFGRNTPSPAFQCAINNGGTDNERAGGTLATVVPMRKLPATAAVVVALGWVRLIADMVPSSRIDMLAGPSRCWTRRMPPCFCASAAVAIAIQQQAGDDRASSMSVQ